MLRPVPASGSACAAVGPLPTVTIASGGTRAATQRLDGGGRAGEACCIRGGGGLAVTRAARGNGGAAGISSPASTVGSSACEPEAMEWRASGSLSLPSPSPPRSPSSSLLSRSSRATPSAAWLRPRVPVPVVAAALRPRPAVVCRTRPAAVAGNSAVDAADGTLPLPARRKRDSPVAGGTRLAAAPPPTSIAWCSPTTSSARRRRCRSRGLPSSSLVLV